MGNSWYHRHVKWLQHWKRCWTEYPDRMEQTRQKGVTCMQQTWVTRNNNLKEALTAWPPIMSKKEFRRLVKELIDSPENLRRKKHRKHCVDSMINRLRNKGFVKFNSDTKFWHNLCRSRQSTDA